MLDFLLEKIFIKIMAENLKVYMSGICGSGMKPLALLASKMDYKIYGSDAVLTNLNHPYYKIFKTYNIEAFSKPDLNLLTNSDFYVYSSAIPEDNVERKKALELQENNQIKIFHRMDFLNYLLKEHEIQLAIAGTHGKTSTTSMVGWLLQNLCLNPTIIVGGTPKFLPHSYRKGNGYIAVYETDESDGSFLKSKAFYRLILNIDHDHLNYYGSFENLIKSFYQFSLNSNCVINNDDEELAKFPRELKKYYIGFGTKLPEHNLYRYFFLGNLNHHTLYFKIFRDKTVIYESNNEGIHFKFPGSHFLKNGLGAIALVFSLLLDYSSLSIRSLGNDVFSSFSINSLIRILNRFSGVERRMDYLGKIHHTDIYDDYGHHPKEILNVLLALKEKYKNRIAIVFQPHRYTRTKELAREFAKVLEYADDIYLLPLYSAGEKPIAGVTSELIGRFIRKNVHYIEDKNFDSIFYNDYDCVVFMGAGDISNQIREYLLKIQPMLTL